MGGEICNSAIQVHTQSMYADDTIFIECRIQETRKKYLSYKMLQLKILAKFGQTKTKQILFQS